MTSHLRAVIFSIIWHILFIIIFIFSSKIESGSVPSIKGPYQIEWKLRPNHNIVQKINPPPRNFNNSLQSNTLANQSSGHSHSQLLILKRNYAFLLSNVIQKKLLSSPLIKIHTFQGKILTKIQIAQGKIIQVTLQASSGTPQLDQDILESIQKISFLPPWPRELSHQTLTLKLPIVFETNPQGRI